MTRVLEYTVNILYGRRYLRQTVGKHKTVQVTPDVSRVDTIEPSKVLEERKEEGSVPYKLLAQDSVSAVKEAVSRFWEDHKDIYGQTKEGDSEQVSYWIVGAEIRSPGALPIKWKAGDILQPPDWSSLKPRSRFLGEVSGGGLRININPTTGKVITSPIPTPPLPRPPMSRDRMKELFHQVTHPFYWKYPTIPKYVRTFKEALEYAWSISYFAGGAELWELPDNLGYAATSKGYYEYIGG
mgnify:FL=1